MNSKFPDYSRCNYVNSNITNGWSLISRVKNVWIQRFLIFSFVLAEYGNGLTQWGIGGNRQLNLRIQSEYGKYKHLQTVRDNQFLVFQKKVTSLILKKSVQRNHYQRRIQNLVKHLKWRFLQKEYASVVKIKNFWTLF